MKYECVVADVSGPGRTDEWEVRCSCGWRTSAPMSEYAADDVASMHVRYEAKAERLREALEGLRDWVSNLATDAQLDRRGGREGLAAAEAALKESEP